MYNRLHFPFRFTLMRLCSTVVLVAIALGGLSRSNSWWAVGLVFLTFVLLLWGTLLGLCARRPFAGGFAIGGVAWLCVLLVFSHPAMRLPDYWPRGGMSVDPQGNVVMVRQPYAIEDNPLNPGQICRWVSSYFHDPARGGGLYMPEDQFCCFRVVASCVATWLIGFLTGLISTLIRRNEERR